MTTTRAYESHLKSGPGVGYSPQQPSNPPSAKSCRPLPPEYKIPGLIRPLDGWLKTVQVRAFTYAPTIAADGGALFITPPPGAAVWRVPVTSLVRFNSKRFALTT